MGWITEFGTEYAVPAWIAKALTDTSWKNDAAPSFTHPTWAHPGDGEWRYRVWIDHPNPDFRELPADGRFAVVEYDAQGSHVSDAALLETDDEQALWNWVREHLPAEQDLPPVASEPSLLIMLHHALDGLVDAVRRIQEHDEYAERDAYTNEKLEAARTALAKARGSGSPLA